MKPIRLTEFGCPAVDRGANAPNLFQDAKSAEGALPPYSTGARDDRMQRRALEAVLTHFSDPANNPVSGAYGAPMLEAADAWCWDARPWPEFPARSDVWADAGAWRTGHWLNGRLGGGTRNLLVELLGRAGLTEADVEIGTPDGEVQGFLVDRPMRVRDALEPLLTALGMVAAERNGGIAIFGREPAVLTLASAALALPPAGNSRRLDRTLEAKPGVARVRFIDSDADYQTGSAVVRTEGDAGGLDMDLPAVCQRSLAIAAAARVLEAGQEERRTLLPGPLESLAMEPGDTVSLDGDDRPWRVMRIDIDETPSAVLQPVSTVAVGEEMGVPSPSGGMIAAGAPFFRVLELPPLINSALDARPVAVAAGDPWRPMRVFAGPDAASLTARGEIPASATIGQLTGGLSGGARHRWDEITGLEVRVEGSPPESLPTSAVLNGGNGLAVETAAGWEIIQFRTAELVAGDVWRLRGLLRGQQGSEQATRTGAPAGALVVFLGAGLERMETPPGEVGLPLIWRAGPAGAPAGGPEVSEVVFARAGLHARPWSPSHLRCTWRVDAGVDLSWLPRSRLDGDRWNGPVAPVDAQRYRVSLLKAGTIVRSFEVTTEAATCTSADLAADFPDGLADTEAAVTQWGDGYGWGVEARIRLV